MSEPQGELIDVFEALGPLGAAERDHLASWPATLLALPARRRLNHEGAPPRAVAFVRSGWLTEFKVLRDGRRQILRIHLPGDIVGLGGILHDLQVATVQTVTSCSILTVPVAAIAGLRDAFPRLGYALLLEALQAQAIVEQWEVNLGRRDAFERVAHLILGLHERLALRGLSTGHSFAMPITQEDIADATGLTPSYVNRLLQRMRKRGLIEIAGDRLRIRDFSALTAAGGFRSDYLRSRSRLQRWPAVSPGIAGPADAPLTS